MSIRTLLTASVLTGVLGLVADARAAGIWQAAADWNTSFNPNGQWSYGFASYAGGNFANNPDTSTFTLYNTGGSLPITGGNVQIRYNNATPVDPNVTHNSNPF